MRALPSEQYHQLLLSSDDPWSGNILTEPDAALLAIAPYAQSAEDTFRGRAGGGRRSKTSLAVRGFFSTASRTARCI